MEKKSYKGLVWLVVILIVLVITLMGFIVYREFYSDDKVNDNNTINTSILEKESIKNVSNFPQKSDSSIISFDIKDLLYDKNGMSLINLTENFKNISYQKHNIKYNMSCDEFIENGFYDPETNQEISNCELVKIKIDDYNLELYYFGSVGCSDETFIILTNDYLIEQAISGCGNGGTITVYDKKGNEVYTEKDSVYMYSKTNNYEDENKVKIAVVDNILYYVSYTEDSILNNKLYFNSLDLSNLKKNQIEICEGIPFGIE